jgi:YegS/Rv2252/BmrU family lipid kinase
MKRLPAIEAAMRSHGLRYRVVMTGSVAHGCEQALKGAAAGEVVVVVSGDGLIGKVGGVLADGAGPLGVIPGGRGNDLARVLSIPTDPAQAARVAVEGPERLIDMAELNGTPYLGVASFGCDSDANRIANEARFVRGNLVYLYAGLRALVAWRPACFTVTVDGERHEFAGYSVAVANSRAYGGGMLIAPQAELDDGKLDVVMTSSMSKLRALITLAKVFKGSHINAPSVHTLRGSAVELTADRVFDIYADGDPIGALPATVRVEPRCLRVIVPG